MHLKAPKEKNKFENKVLYFSLTGCFFFFFFRSVFEENLSSTLISLSPLFPIPVTGLLILFAKKDIFELRASHLSICSQVSVIFAALIYLLILVLNESISSFYNFYPDRIYLFSGNPIPFSFVMVGLSIFCLAGWHSSYNNRKLIAISCFLIGIYLAGFASGTRSTLLSIILIVPIVIFYLSKSLKQAFMLILAVSLILLSIIFLYQSEILTSSYFSRIEAGLDTLLLSKNTESSVKLRLGMWSASIKTISEAPLFGYNITNRFDAIVPYLPSYDFSNRSFSHPHNDFFATIIAGGFFGGFLCFFSIATIFLTAFLSNEDRPEKLYFGLMLLVPTLITASFSTVLFNDISSGWLALSVYLIWNTKFKE